MLLCLLYWKYGENEILINQNGQYKRIGKWLWWYCWKSEKHLENESLNLNENQEYFDDAYIDGHSHTKGLEVDSTKALKSYDDSINNYDDVKQQDEYYNISDTFIQDKDMFMLINEHHSECQNAETPFRK